MNEYSESFLKRIFEGLIDKNRRGRKLRENRNQACAFLSPVPQKGGRGEIKFEGGGGKGKRKTRKGSEEEKQRPIPSKKNLWSL